MTPPALALAEAFSALGLFSVEGLRAISERWNTVEFTDTQGSTETRQLHHGPLDRPRYRRETRHRRRRTKACRNRLYDWQMPMYNFDFSLIPVSLDKLQRERDAMFYAEFGDYGDY